jgi:type I restriction enzyme R subunit
MNPDMQARYAANRLRVVRQVRTPSTTKTASTWCCSSTASRWPRPSSRPTSPRACNDAVDQYRFDRHPFKPKGKAFAEPLLDFPAGRWCTSP